jgi:ABC-type transport system involved in multi-copper enzyme maturation permease subunit
MTFLPIVDRELRAAARRRATFRFRWLAVLVGLIITFTSLLFLAAGAGPKNVGGPLFSVLTVCAFFLCPLLGVALTADSLSEEKREGTLGLLFLTDLKGYDVVLGKFAASSLNAFYGLLALLPIMALPLLLGGVTGGQFFRVSLTLINALFFSLAVGIFVSSFTRESRASLGGTLWLLLLLTVVFPVAGRLGEALRVSPGWISLTAISPFYPFAWAGDVLYRSHAAKFWETLAASHLTGWFFLGLASFILPRAWRETGDRIPRRHRVHPLELAARANAQVHRRRKAEALTVNPVLWVIGGEPALRSAVWVIVCIWGAVVLATSRFWPREPVTVYSFG